MTPSEIKPGMIFRNYEVIKFDHAKNRHKYFLCKCHTCGQERIVRADRLLKGVSYRCCKECGDPMIGAHFGRWVVLKQDKVSKNRHQFYLCKCDCGTVKSVDGSSLRSGQTLSCGCLKEERQQQRRVENAESHIGEKYGFLTIVGYEDVPGKGYCYKCQCDCGNKVTVRGRDLFSGNTSSCGCLNSKANELMDKLLTRENIPFKREYRFEDCCDKKPLPFDFAIFNRYNELIGLMELNGSLHYSASGTGWNTPERLIVQQKHDYLKRKFCEENNIPFLVIPYQYFNGTEMEKFLKTSDFWKIIIRNFND